MAQQSTESLEHALSSVMSGILITSASWKYYVTRGQFMTGLILRSFL
jgi:hypothetical protein